MQTSGGKDWFRWYRAHTLHGNGSNGTKRNRALVNLLQRKPQSGTSGSILPSDSPMLRKITSIITSKNFPKLWGLIYSPRTAFTRNRLVKTETHGHYRLEFVDKAQSSISKLLSVLPGGLKQIIRRSFDTRDAGTMPLVPPECVRGMTKLNRDAFTKYVEIPSLLVPIAAIGRFQNAVKKYLIKVLGVRPIAELDEENPKHDKYRLFLFDPDKITSKDDIEKLSGIHLNEYDIDIESWEVVSIELSYKNWQYDEILRAVVPAEIDGVGGFSIIGHILHLNLKEELSAYKNIIGEVLLDKVAPVKTVVNKINTIDNTFRNFSMEVLAGKEDFITVSKENGLSFKMDFSKVYWNPRLNTEHERIVKQLTRNDVLYDVFAGIGPFAVPAAKRRCTVLANDLNPESYKWLAINMTENKVKKEPKLYNMDGRDFIRTVLKADLVSRWKDLGPDVTPPCVHIVMNLPALAVEFLDAFVGLLGDADSSLMANVGMPKVHVYCFSKEKDPVVDVRRRVEAVLGRQLPDSHSIRLVRNVAPNKEMLCAEFELDKDVLLGNCIQTAGDVKTEAESSDEPPDKRKRLDSC